MKKHIFVFIVVFSILILLPVEQYAMSISGGLFYGPRSVNSADITSVYGKGSVYTPYLTIALWQGLFIGADYEGGYSRTAKIGIYGETASLDIHGFEFFMGYELKIKSVAPYIRVGGAYFSYKQTISSNYVGNITVNENKMTFSIGGGLKIYPINNVFLAAEVKYIPLKVKPLDVEVDLSGLRILGGAGFAF